MTQPKPMSLYTRQCTNPSDWETLAALGPSNEMAISQKLEVRLGGGLYQKGLQYFEVYIGVPLLGKLPNLVLLIYRGLHPNRNMAFVRRTSAEKGNPKPKNPKLRINPLDP